MVCKKLPTCNAKWWFCIHTDFISLFDNDDILLCGLDWLVCMKRLPLIDGSKSKRVGEMMLKPSYVNGWPIRWQPLEMDEWICICRVFSAWDDMPWCSSALDRRWRMVFPTQSALQLRHLDLFTTDKRWNLEVLSLLGNERWYVEHSFERDSEMNVEMVTFVYLVKTVAK